MSYQGKLEGAEKEEDLAAAEEELETQKRPETRKDGSSGDPGRGARAWKGGGGDPMDETKIRKEGVNSEEEGN